MPGVLTAGREDVQDRPSITVARRRVTRLDFDGRQDGRPSWTGVGEPGPDAQAPSGDPLEPRLRGGLLEDLLGRPAGDPFEVMAVEDARVRSRSFSDLTRQPLRPTTPEWRRSSTTWIPAVAETARSKTLFPGDVAVHVRSPFAIFPDPLAPEEGLEDRLADRGDHPVRRPGSRDRYDVDLEADSGASAGVLEARMPGLDDGSKTGVVVREFWAPKVRGVPQGQALVYAGAGPQGGGQPLRLAALRDVPRHALPGPLLADVLHRAGHQPADRAQQDPEPDRRERQRASATRRWPSPARPTSSGTACPGSVLLFDDTLQNSLPQFLQVPEMPGYVQNRVPQLSSHADSPASTRSPRATSPRASRQPRRSTSSRRPTTPASAPTSRTWRRRSRTPASASSSSSPSTTPTTA
jgi:hypothetical protein